MEEKSNPAPMPESQALPFGKVPVEKLLRSRILAAVRSNVMLSPLTMIVGIAGSVGLARTLGPELLAVVNAIGAMASLLVVFLDFGLTRSLPKILPELSVRFGRQVAVSAMMSLLRLRLVMVLLGLGILIAIQAKGVILGPARLAASHWTFPLVGLAALLSSISGFWHASAAAAFHHHVLNRISLAASIVAPLVSVIVALVYRNPYVVAFATQCVLALQIFLIANWARYDLDDVGQTKGVASVSWRSLLHVYGKYSGATYIAFLFNRFAFSSSLVIWVMSSAGASAASVANASLAMGIVASVFDLANLPVNQIQGPLLARLFAEGNEARFARVQRLLVAVLSLTSGGLAILIAGLGPTVLKVLYGLNYASAVKWAVFGSLLAMLGNPFSLGNTTLMQRDCFRPVLVGLGISLLSIVAGTWLSLQWMSAELGFGLVLTALGSRVVFWLVTDLWCDGTVFKWEGSVVKLRAVLATVLAVGSMLVGQWNRPEYLVWGIPIAGLIWLVAWRATGGLGSVLRAQLTGMLVPQLRPLVRYF